VRLRQTERRYEPRDQVKRPSDALRALAERPCVRLRLGEVRAHPGVREVARGEAARHVVERDPALLERPHEPDEVDVGRIEAALGVRREDPELHEPPDERLGAAGPARPPPAR